MNSGERGHRLAGHRERLLTAFPLSDVERLSSDNAGEAVKVSDILKALPIVCSTVSSGSDTSERAGGGACLFLKEGAFSKDLEECNNNTGMELCATAAANFGNCLF